MHQITQQLKSGKMEILEVPFPALENGQLLVRIHYSVISAGTESKTVTDARKGYIAKAKSRQKEVKQVIEMIKTDGLLPTYKLVMNKLEAPSLLGYSCAGEVIAMGDGVKGFKIGDKVACGGQGAYHADVVAVYEKLCVKVSENLDLRHAAFATIASIAIQGIRQADVRFGETCAVIGLGLLGQLTMQILNASSIKAIGIDINDTQIEAAKGAGAKFAFNRDQPGVEDIISNITSGYGADAVIITAGTSSLDPIEFAGSIARKRGKVVIVGAVPTGFSRANYYKKELDLRMSCSYGPGRYDPSYEEKGIDYPIGYVRWTENRNMQSFIDLLSERKLNINKIITHTFDLFEAPEAYNLILAKSEPVSGILIKYDNNKKLKQNTILKQGTTNPEEPNIGFIGAGNFAQNMLLPRMKGMCNFVSIATANGNESVYVAKKYGFSKCFNNGDDVIHDKDVNTVFVVTRHNLHANFVKNAIQAGKNVFVEKPLAMNIDELEEIKKIYVSLEKPPKLMVGFNRRFSPAIQEIKKIFIDEQQKAINMRINAGVLPAEHWVNDPEVGGGRIIGEVCHFIDLAMYIAGSKIKTISANSLNDPDDLKNTVTINLNIENGSIANISYFSNGSKKLGKEYIEVFCDGNVGIIDDFKTLVFYTNKIKRFKFKGQNKGHKEELIRFLNSISKGLPAPIPFEDIYLNSLATFKVIESIRTGRTISL